MKIVTLWVTGNLALRMEDHNQALELERELREAGILGHIVGVSAEFVDVRFNLMSDLEIRFALKVLAKRV